MCRVLSGSECVPATANLLIKYYLRALVVDWNWVILSTQVAQVE